MPTIPIVPETAAPAPFAITPSAVAEAKLIAAYAEWDGTDASGSFLPCLAIYSDAGVRLGRVFPSSSVAAGDKAVVTYAPFPGGIGRSGGSSVQTTDGTTTVNPTTEIFAGSGLILDNPTTGEARLRVASPPNPGGTVLVYDYTVTGASKASIDTNVDGPYAGPFRTDLTELEVWLTSRSDEAGLDSSLNGLLNNDSGSHYDRTFVATSKASVNTVTDAGTQTGLGGLLIATACAGMTAGVAAYLRCTIPDYSQNVFFKVMEATFGVVDTVAGITHRQALVEIFQWENTAPVTRLSFTPATAGVKLLVGTRLTIWGR